MARLAIALVALAVLLGLAARDIARDRHNTRRVKEYAFLCATTFAALVYGVVHDEITVTISPEYFLVFKALADDPRPMRLATAVVAVRASWWVGLLLGAVLLVANNPRPTGRPSQLRYAELGRLAAIPLLAACLGAIGGAANSLDPFGLSTTVRPLVPDDRVRAFLLVWGIHIGSYAGAAIGAACSVGLIIVRRRRRRAERRS